MAAMRKPRLKLPLLKKPFRPLKKPLLLLKKPLLLLKKPLLLRKVPQPQKKLDWIPTRDTITPQAKPVNTITIMKAITTTTANAAMTAMNTRTKLRSFRRIL